VSALVAEYVRSLSEHKPELAQARAQWSEVRAGIKRFSASHRLSRGELYDRTLR
jgi:hypothetical protein